MVLIHMNEVEILYVGRGVACAYLNTTFIAYWYGEVIDDEVERILSELQKFSSQIRGDFSYLSMSGAQAKSPNGEQRKEIMNTLPTIVHLKRMAIWLEASGFGAAMMRSAIGAMRLLVLKSPIDYEIFGDHKKACEWLEKFKEEPHLIRASKAFALEVDTLLRVAD